MPDEDKNFGNFLVWGLANGYVMCKPRIPDVCWYGQIPTKGKKQVEPSD